MGQVTVKWSAVPTHSGADSFGSLESGGLDSRATDFGSGYVHTWGSRVWGLEAGGLEARATSFGSGRAHACPLETIYRTLKRKRGLGNY